MYIPSVDTYNRDITEVLDEIMDVPKRPVEIQEAIRTFRNAVMHGNKKVACNSLVELKNILSSDDPYWVTAEHLVSRMERMK